MNDQFMNGFVVLLVAAAMVLVFEYQSTPIIWARRAILSGFAIFFFMAAWAAVSGWIEFDLVFWSPVIPLGLLSHWSENPRWRTFWKWAAFAAFALSVFTIRLPAPACARPSECESLTLAASVRLACQLIIIFLMLGAMMAFTPPNDPPSKRWRMAYFAAYGIALTVAAIALATEWGALAQGDVNSWGFTYEQRRDAGQMFLYANFGLMPVPNWFKGQPLVQWSMTAVMILAIGLHFAIFS